MSLLITENTDLLKWINEEKDHGRLLSWSVEGYNSDGLTGDLFVLNTVINCKVGNGDEEEQEQKQRQQLIKRFPPARLEFSRSLGLAREGLFLNFLKGEEAGSLFQALTQVIPRISMARGDMATGEKIIVMEKLEGINSAYLFGQHNILFKEHELFRYSEQCSAVRAGEQCAAMAALMHAQFWRDKSLVEHEWTRSREIVRQALALEGQVTLQSGEEDTTWRSSMDTVLNMWRGVKSGSSPKIRLSPHLVQCVDNSLAKIDWTTDRERFVRGTTTYFPFTLVHGDFHAGNCIYLPTSNTFKMVDFEMVGLGSGPQDIAQFLISNMEPTLRREKERGIINHYFNQLTAHLQERAVEEAPDLPSLEGVWEEYVRGGAGRWIWFAVYLISAMDDEKGQFFHDIVAAFLRDHFPNPALVPMPRV